MTSGSVKTWGVYSSWKLQSPTSEDFVTAPKLLERNAGVTSSCCSKFTEETAMAMSMGALHSVDVGHAWGTPSGGESMAFTMNQEQEKHGGCVSFCGAVP